MGRVWRGFDPQLGRPVAIKTVKSEYLTRDTREEYLRRFRREARAAGLLSHPNIVRIHDVGEDYFVMELVEGVTLADLLKHRERLEVAEALNLLTPLSEAIDEAHRAGVIHRDIKPANIMVQSDGRPKLMDFGVARLETSVATAAGHFWGSPSYMAPEQIAGGELTSRGDLFSFAVVAYEMLTGRRPFVGDNVPAVMYHVVNGTAPAPSSLLPDLPPHFDDVFRCALAKTPAQRFGTAGAFVAALRGEDLDSLLLPLLAGMEAEAARPAAPEQETQALTPAPAAPRPRRATLWVAAVLLVVLAAALATLRLRAAPAVMAPALQIGTEPVQAEVWLDGRPAGRSPVQLERLAPGPHRVRVGQEGFAPAELQLQVTADMGIVPLRFSLTPVTAPLTVRTQEGVTVLVDGKPVGTTPLGTVHIDPGLHRFDLEKRGHEPQRLWGVARAGEPLTVESRLAAKSAGRTEPFWTTHAPPTPPAAEPPEPPLTTTTPTRLSGDTADYPEAARRLQLEGSVLVVLTVERDGSVSDASVLESAGVILDQAVKSAVRSWRFAPLLVDGQPTRFRWPFRQTFRPR
jgi:TonB family protein